MASPAPLHGQSLHRCPRLRLWQVLMYKHDKTGAQLMSVVNSDENKTFGVTFRCGSTRTATVQAGQQLVAATFGLCIAFVLVWRTPGCSDAVKGLLPLPLAVAQSPMPPKLLPPLRRCHRTPVANSRGVPHILEHSVLCGSRKYPIKVRGVAGRWVLVWSMIIGVITIDWKRLRAPC